MRKVILMLLSTVLTNMAMAEWVEVGATRIFTAYAEPSTIIRTGNIVKMWDAMDFLAPQTAIGKPFLSIKSQREFNCKELLLRVIYTRYYSQKMGDGNVVATSNEVRDWAPVSPESIDQLLWQFACARK